MYFFKSLQVYPAAYAEPTKNNVNKHAKTRIILDIIPHFFSLILIIEKIMETVQAKKYIGGANLFEFFFIAVSIARVRCTEHSRPYGSEESPDCMGRHTG